MQHLATRDTANTRPAVRCFQEGQSPFKVKERDREKVPLSGACPQGDGLGAPADLIAAGVLSAPLNYSLIFIFNSKFIFICLFLASSKPGKLLA